MQLWKCIKSFCCHTIISQSVIVKTRGHRRPSHLKKKLISTKMTCIHQSTLWSIGGIACCKGQALRQSHLGIETFHVPHKNKRPPSNETLGYLRLSSNCVYIESLISRKPLMIFCLLRAPWWYDFLSRLWRSNYKCP